MSRRLWPGVPKALASVETGPVNRSGSTPVAEVRVRIRFPRLAAVLLFLQGRLKVRTR